jgi:hypothetical protein
VEDTVDRACGRQRKTERSTEHLGEGQTSVSGERRELTNLWCLLERRLISAHPAHPKHRPSHAPVDQRAANLTHWKFAGFVAAGWVWKVCASQILSLRLSRGFPSRVFVVVNELGSITDNDEYMLHLWVWNEGTTGLAVVRFCWFPE